MTKKARKAWLEERAFLALVIAAHRGHEKLVKRLIEAGGNSANHYTPFIIFLSLSHNVLPLRLNVTSLQKKFFKIIEMHVQLSGCWIHLEI